MAAIYLLIGLAVWIWLMFEAMDWIKDPEEDNKDVPPKALMVVMFLASFLGGLFWPALFTWLTIEVIKDIRKENKSN